MEKYRRWEHHGAFLSMDENVRMKEWAEKWFDDYSGKIEESTIPRYRNTLSHIIKFFGNRHVDSMSAADIEYCIEEMAKVYSGDASMLGQILRKAEANGLIAKNPVPLADSMNYRRIGKKRGRKAA